MSTRHGDVERLQPSAQDSTEKTNSRSGQLHECRSRRCDVTGAIQVARTPRDVCSVEGVCWRLAHLRPLTRQTQAQAITQCTSWRCDGSPSCLGGSSHGWVPVNTHGTTVLTSVMRLWVAHSPRALHKQAMSSRPKFFQQFYSHVASHLF